LVTAPAAPRLDLQALREAMSAETAPETSALATVPAGPAAQPASIEALIGSPSFLSPPGRPPSTLESQAEALAAAQEVSTAARVAREPAPALRDGNGPASPSHVSALGPQSRLAAAPTGSGFEIQIGAYATSEEAESRMAAARSRAPGLLEGHASVTLPVQKGERQVFRARFTSFDESVASSACLELRRLAIDCFVMKAE
jgi:D-alanyl-D-alanine carboxypeptidase